MEIRKMTIEDVNKNEKEIVSLFEQITKDNYPSNLDMNEYINNKPFEMRRYIEDGTAIIYGSFQNDVLTGFIWGYKKVYFGEFRVHIAHAAVDEAYRNTNTFVRLAFRMRNEARKLGAVSLECMATYDNEKLIEHYQSLGFQIERASMVKSI